MYGLKCFASIGFYMKCVIGRSKNRVSVQGVKSLGGHFACLCQRLDFYGVKNECFSK